MKTQTRILDNRLYYTRKIELHRKGKKSHTVRITPILICPSVNELRRVHYSKMGKVPTTIRDVALKTCRKQWTIGRGWRERVRDIHVDGTR